MNVMAMFRQLTGQVANTDRLRSLVLATSLSIRFFIAGWRTVIWIEKLGSARNSQFRSSDRQLLPIDRNCNENRAADAA
jgi:hypothetical protein